MANYTTTYTFTAGTKIKASEANANFSNIGSFLNDSVIHVDGSKSFTGVPTVAGAAAVNPTSANQLTRKQYVDDQVTTLTTTVTANKTAQDNGFKVRPTISGVDNQIVKSGNVVVTTDANGEATITFAAAFPNSIINVVACCGDATAVFVTVLHPSLLKASFKIRAFSENIVTVGAASGIDRFRNANVRVSYIAVGT